MTIEYKNKVDALLKLQKVELEIAAIQAGIEGYPALVAGLEEELTTASNDINTAELRLSELQQTYRSLETDTQTYQARIDKSQEKLAQVKTNKEYQSSLKEIEELKQLQSGVEDNMLQCLEDMDTAEAAVSEKRADFDSLKEHIEDEKTKLQQEHDQQEKQLHRISEQRSQALELIDPKLLETYNIIKQKCGDIGVAVVKDAVCQACNVNIPPQMFNELQKFDKLLFCPHCQRIIYPLTA